MTMGEDLLLLAIRRHGVEFIPREVVPGLKAAELVDLALAGRIKVRGTWIAVSDRTPVGAEPLDQALVALGRGSGLEDWIPRYPWHFSDSRVTDPYMARLAAQGVIRIDDRKRRGLRIRYKFLDLERRTQARARVDRVARDLPDVSTADWALAGLAHACEFDRHLFRGLRGRAIRERLAELFDNPHIAAGPQAATDTADAAFADEAAKALFAGIAKLPRRATVGWQGRADPVQLLDVDPVGFGHQSHHPGSGPSHHHHHHHQGHSGGHHAGDFGGHSGGHDGGGGHH